MCENRLKHKFMALGFRSKHAFFEICRELDKTITMFQLKLFWNYDVCNPVVFGKIENIIEKLKDE